MASAPVRPARRNRVAATVLTLTATAALAAGCSALDGDSSPAGGPAPAGSGAPAPERVPPAQSLSPFTGQAARQGPVLAVKFDNASEARPHTGIGDADIVYVEKVEGGMSRLMGVYSGKLPKAAGPVRSARESDIELLRQFGRPALAYSGVRSALLKTLQDSPVHARTHTDVPEAYFRQSGRPAPHDLFVRPKALLRSMPKADRPADIGFRFGPAPAGGTPMARMAVDYDLASHTFDWSADEGRWLASFDGAPARSTSGARLGARTVVIQYVTMRSSRYKDYTGAVTPYIETVGGGEALVLRDGKSYPTRWARPSATAGTTFTLPDGRRMPFAPGQVWIVYADRS
ncbi:DUF3048 domain-containing protein [Streptomyces sp. NPDC023327]|uniref:DUF3048 domain-containing protein n=1 Tax=Streptomyces sp. NPDC023327 TaxID=3157088 RepID=UPI003410B635